MATISKIISVLNMNIPSVLFTHSIRIILYNWLMGDLGFLKLRLWATAKEYRTRRQKRKIYMNLSKHKTKRAGIYMVELSLSCLLAGESTVRTLTFGQSARKTIGRIGR